MSFTTPFIAILLGGTPAPSVATSMVLTLSVDGGPGDLEAFLVQQARETWDTAIDIPRAGSEPMHLIVDNHLGYYFYVNVHWLSERQVTVVVENGGQTLTERTIEVDDPVRAKLTLWLLLKSTIDRGLKQAVVPEVRHASLALRQKTPEEKADPAKNDASVAADGGEPKTKVRKKTAAVSTPIETGWGLGALLTVGLETPHLTSMGVSATAAFDVWHLSLGAQAGYRYAPGPSGLEVHALPVSGTAALFLGEAIRADVGLIATGEMKFPMGNAGPSAVFGAEAGGFAQARARVSERLSLALRVAVVARLLFHNYVFTIADGQFRNVQEQPWTSAVSFGMEWR